MEEWRPIDGFPDYEVSDLGRIRSHKRGDLRILKLGKDKDGYVQVVLSTGSTRCTKRVHQLVLLAFAGPRPPGAETRHLNGDKADNRPLNLAWGSSAENGEDKCSHGSGRGARNGRARFTDVEVLQIRADLEKGEPAAHIARRLNVPTGTIEDIGRGRTWTHLGDPIENRQPQARPQRITQAVVDDVQARFSRGETGVAIAKALGIGQWAVSKIRNNQLSPRRK